MGVEEIARLEESFTAATQGSGLRELAASWRRQAKIAPQPAFAAYTQAADQLEAALSQPTPALSPDAGVLDAAATSLAAWLCKQRPPEPIYAAFHALCRVATPAWYVTGHAPPPVAAEPAPQAEGAEDILTRTTRLTREENEARPTAEYVAIAKAAHAEMRAAASRTIKELNATVEKDGPMHPSSAALCAGHSIASGNLAFALDYLEKRAALSAPAADAGTRELREGVVEEALLLEQWSKSPPDTFGCVRILASNLSEVGQRLAALTRAGGEKGGAA